MTTADERQTSGSSEAVAAAKEVYRQSVAAELPLSGKALGQMFDRSESWGRGIIRALKAESALPENGSGLPQNGSDSGNLLVKHASGGQPADAELPAVVELLPSAVAPTPAADLALTRQENDSNGSVAAAESVSAAVSRQPATVTTAVLWSSRVSVVVVAVVAAAVSYEHMRSLADRTGEGWLSWLLPLSVDGLMVAASMVMLVRRRQGRPVGLLAWSALIGGVVASLAANVGASLLPDNVTPDPWIKATVAAWPPIALLLAYELLMQLVRDARTEGTNSQ